MNSNSTLRETAPATAEDIKNLIERHRVCFESWYEYAMTEEVRCHTGYALRLSGVNKHETDEHPVPGCDFCRQTYNDLCRIARWILPPGDRASKYRIEPFDSSFHFAKTRGHREEVVVTIQVLHRDETDRAADECELRCLKEMREKLKELGVLEGRVNKSFEKR
jgi:hypothetical protein